MQIRPFNYSVTRLSLIASKVLDVIQMQGICNHVDIARMRQESRTNPAKVIGQIQTLLGQIKKGNSNYGF